MGWRGSVTVTGDVLHPILLLKKVKHRGWAAKTASQRGGRKDIRMELISTELKGRGSLEFIENFDIKLRIFWFIDGKNSHFCGTSVPKVGQF